MSPRLEAVSRAPKIRTSAEYLQLLCSPYHRTSDKLRRLPLLLTMIYEFRPDLQAVFDVGTEAGLGQFLDWFRISSHREYECFAGLFDPGASPLNNKSSLESRGRQFTTGVNLIGYSRAELGMGEHVRMSALAFEDTGTPFVVYNFAVGIASRQEDTLCGHLESDELPHLTNIFHVNADQMLAALSRLGAESFGDRYNIAYWAWELPRCPAEWMSSIELVDEIWAPSQFIHEAFSTATTKPVIHMPLCVNPTLKRCWTKRDFGLNEHAFAFVFTFDSFSYIERKNPLAIIAAFRRAFRRGNEPVQLVLKTMNADQVSLAWQQLALASAGDDRIALINQTFERDKALGLIQACDCFVSLHRSEGFGRGPSEAMAFGRPVIATNWSGNTDFCNAQTACLVKFNLVPVVPSQYPFSLHQVWADPDVDHAAWWMQRLVSDPQLCAAIGHSGQQYILDNHNPRAIGSRYAERLQVLGVL
jgi:glycosyltransferase involved in cell wall biosynthesis